ncbi:WYL domain-containing protein [Zobellella taiwanensis]
MPALSAQLSSHSHAQRERLAFIDFCLQYHGSVGRGELMGHFGTAVASGTRDFTLYRELAPNNLELRHEDKRYYRKDSFQALFEHDSRTVLNILAHGFGNGVTTEAASASFCEDAPDLSTPSPDILAPLSRAISQQQAIKIHYLSLSSGSSERTLVPHSLANNGKRWYLRAYDRKHESFRDFACMRIVGVEQSESPAVQSHEQQHADQAWNTLLTLELVPHPGLAYPEAIARDYGMTKQHGHYSLQLTTRAARAGYLLRYWNVDASANHHLPATEHHLWLRNVSALTQQHSAVLSNFTLAPGFNKEPKPI